MHILFLTQIIPYPPDAGPRVKTWHVLRYLAGRGHHVTLVSFVRPEEEEFLPELRKVVSAVHTVPITRSRWSDGVYWLRSQLTRRPFLIERDDRATMRRLVDHLVRSQRIDVIHADQLGMAQFALPYAGQPGTKGKTGGIRLIFDAHNAVWTIIRRMGENAPAVFRPLASLEARRIKAYEGMIVRSFDHTLAVTQPDRQALLQATSTAPDEAQAIEARLNVVPIAVDTQALPVAARQPASSHILTLGTLHYPPNADGIRWFLRQVLPLVRREIPDTMLTIIGKKPPADFLEAAAGDSGLKVTGYVPDLGPYMDQAAILVVPVRAGGGMRVRILEAFARGMPVVTTTVGLEGIKAEPEQDVLVADTPADFARQVVRLLGDTALQSQLAQRGRSLAERQYDWQVTLRKMEQIYGGVETEGKAEVAV